jgi:16S rRNA (cytosine1402-N4)-methyltransferase
MKMKYHEPVLLKECIEGLDIKPNGIYVDMTFGGGGHSKEIIKHLKDGRLIAFDQDDDATANIIEDKRFLLLNNNYKFLKNFLKFHKAFPVDGILADLGISSHQIDNAVRGFSIRFDDSVLDLRMDNRNALTAVTVLNDYDGKQLVDVLRNYGELDNARRISEQIINYRAEKKIVKVIDLKEAVVSLAKKGAENKFFAKIFQALRIEVNAELESLKEALLQTVDALKPGGRLVVISYHSLEDRLVKNFMKSGNFEGKIEKDILFGDFKVPFSLKTKKPIVPGDKEIEENSRSRSAKLRIAEKNS